MPHQAFCARCIPAMSQAWQGRTRHRRDRPWRGMAQDRRRRPQDPRLQRLHDGLFVGEPGIVASFGRLATGVTEHLLLVGIELVPDRFGDGEKHRLHHMRGQHDLLGNFVEFRRIENRQRIFLAVHRAGLQGEIDFRHAQRHRRDAKRAAEQQPFRPGRHAHLDAGEIGRRFDGALLPQTDLARAEIMGRQNSMPILSATALRKSSPIGPSKTRRSWS